LVVDFSVRSTVSQARLKSDLKQLDKQVHKQLEEAQKKLQELEKKDFACAADALKEAELLNKKLRYHQLHQIEVKPMPYYNKAGRGRIQTLGENKTSQKELRIRVRCCSTN